jgi:UDP-2,3-diacylglucosamine hydrolase
MTTWFISDLHLAPEETRITAGFLDFMLEPQDGDHLYILGDFFNYWLGDDVPHPYIDSIKQVLKASSERGVKLFFMHGNRDFLIGQQFCQDTHMTLLEDPSIITLNNETVLLMHGDSLCTLDTEYMAFREMVRQEKWQTQFLSQTLEERLAFANKAREESQKGNAQKEQTIMDVTPDEVVNALKTANVTRLIHGHTHRPAIHDFEIGGANAQRIVLGDWYTQGWYLKVDEQGYRLVDFDLPNV